MSRYYLGKSPRNPYALPRRKRLWGRWAFLAVSGLLVGLLLLMFSTAFAITEVRVEGATDTNTIRVAAQEKISGWSRLPTFRTSHVKQRLMEGGFTFESVELEKDYPHTLVVHVVERTPRAVWQTPARAWLVDQNGRVVGEWGLDKPRDQNLAYFFDESGTPPIDGQLIDSARIAIILEFQEQLRTKVGLEMLLIKLESPTSPFVKYVTSEGWELYIDFASDLEAQLEKLTAVLTNLNTERPTLHYIDVRFADRVYYQ